MRSGRAGRRAQRGESETIGRWVSRAPVPGPQTRYPNRSIGAVSSACDRAPVSNGGRRPRARSVPRTWGAWAPADAGGVGEPQSACRVTISD